MQKNLSDSSVDQLENTILGNKNKYLFSLIMNFYISKKMPLN